MNTKRDLVYGALDEIGIGADTFDPSPEQLEKALNRLDWMMAEWDGLGIRIGYLLPTTPQDSDLDQEAGVPDTARNCIVSNLAIRLAPTYGKTVPPSTMAAAARAYNALLTARAEIPQQRFPNTLPLGQGNIRYTAGQQYFQNGEKIDLGPSGELDYNA